MLDRTRLSLDSSEPGLESLRSNIMPVSSARRRVLFPRLRFLEAECSVTALTAMSERRGGNRAKAAASGTLGRMRGTQP